MNRGAFRNATRGEFVSKSYALPGGGVVANVTHGLGGVPDRCEWRLVCLASEAGFSIGDEVLVSVANGGHQAFTAGANNTNVFLVLEKSSSGTANFSWASKTDGTMTSMTLSKWAARCYAYRNHYKANL